MWDFLKKLSAKVALILGIILMILIFSGSLEVHTGVVDIKNGLVDWPK